MATKTERLPIEIEQEEEGLSFTELFLMFWRKRVLITVMAVVGALAGALTSAVINSQTVKVSSIVEYQWDGINKGEYPNGSRFDVINAFSPSVYNTSLELLDLDLTVNETRNELTVTPVVPRSVLDSIQAAVERGETFSYFPTVYRYTLNISNLSLSDEQGKLLLDDLINEFTSEFQRTYVTQTVVKSLSFDNFDSFDLLDQVLVIKNQIDSMTVLIEDLIEFKPNAAIFRSSTLNNLSLNDILSQLALTRSLQLNSVEALIVANQLSTDSGLTVDRLTYNNRLMNVELAKANQFLTELNLLVENYTGSTSTIIIPGYDGQINTTSALESIYERIIETQEIIAELEQDIIYNELIIAEFENANTNTVLNTRAQDELNDVVEDLTSIINNTNTLLSEFNQVLNRNTTRVLVNATIEAGVSLVLYSAIGLFALGFVSLIVVFFTSSKLKKE
jgi:hypothetical protein